MTARKPLDTRVSAIMVLLCAIWGFQQVAMKMAAPFMAPVLQIALRSALAAIVIAGLVVVRGEVPAMRSGSWKPGLLVGTLFAGEFLFVGEGLRFTSASHMSIFLYTAPIFAALGLHLRMPEERLTPLQWLGIAIAFAGIVISFVGRGAQIGGGTAWIGDMLGVAAGASYGATTVSVRLSHLSNAPATVTLLYQLVGAAVVLMAAAMLLGQTRVIPTSTLLLCMGFQVLVVCIFSFLFWFALLRRYLASRLGVLSFMTPLFGVLFGVVVLGERLDLPFLLGAALVMAGILLVGGRDLFLREDRARRGSRQG